MNPTKINLSDITTVADYIQAGGLKTGFYLFPLIKESEKAFSTEAKKFTTTALNTYKVQCWFPKSKTKILVDDFYLDTKGQNVILVPQWLYDAKREQGYDF